MIHGVYAIFDSKAAAFLQPFVSSNDGTAARAVRAAAVGQSQLAQFPEDYTLMRVGSFDDVTGRLVGVELPTVVATIASLKERQDA